MKIFQIHHDSDKTLNKDGNHEKDFSSNSEANNNIVNSSSHHSSIKSRARTKQKLMLGRSYLRMTQHNMYTVSLSGGEHQCSLCRYLYSFRRIGLKEMFSFFLEYLKCNK